MMWWLLVVVALLAVAILTISIVSAIRQGRGKYVQTRRWRRAGRRGPAGATGADGTAGATGADGTAGATGGAGRDGGMGPTGAAGSGGGGAAFSIPQHVYSVPGTYGYSPCDGTNSLRVLMWGGGGAGGVPEALVPVSSGGGAGAFVETIVPLFPRTQITIVVGAGSIAGVTGASESAVFSGETGSPFAIIAGGGQDGLGPDIDQPGGAGGIPSVTNPGVPDFLTFSVSGQDGQASSNVTTAGNGGSSPFGGAGGFAATNNSAGTNGIQAGGGGGGAANGGTFAPGNGGNGLVIVYPSATSF